MTKLKILFCFILLLGAGLKGYGQRHCVLYVNDYWGKPIPNVHFYQEGTNIDTTFNTGRITFIIPNDFESGYRKIFAPFYKEANRLGYKYSDKDSVQFIVLENKDFLYELHNDTITTIPRPFGIKSPWNMHIDDPKWFTNISSARGTVYTFYNELKSTLKLKEPPRRYRYEDSVFYLIRCNKRIIRELPEIDTQIVALYGDNLVKLPSYSLRYSSTDNINIPCSSSYFGKDEVLYILEDLYEILIEQGYDSDKILFVSATDMTYKTICYVKPQIHVVLKQGYTEEYFKTLGIIESCIQKEQNCECVIYLGGDDLRKGFDFWLKKLISCQLFSTVELVKKE